MMNKLNRFAYVSFWWVMVYLAFMVWLGTGGGLGLLYLLFCIVTAVYFSFEFYRDWWNEEREFQND